MSLYPCVSLTPFPFPQHVQTTKKSQNAHARSLSCARSLSLCLSVSLPPFSPPSLSHTHAHTRIHSLKHTHVHANARVQRTYLHVFSNVNIHTLAHSLSQVEREKNAVQLQRAEFTRLKVIHKISYHISYTSSVNAFNRFVCVSDRCVSVCLCPLHLCFCVCCVCVCLFVV